MQMMNVAMQLLQKREGENAAAGGSGNTAAGSVDLNAAVLGQQQAWAHAASVPRPASADHTQPQPQAHSQQQQQQHHQQQHQQQSAQQRFGGSDGDAVPVPLSEGGNNTGSHALPAWPEGSPHADSNVLTGGSGELPDAVGGSMPRMGFKPQSATADAYAAAVGSEGFSFPPLGGMPAGWPPANMVDQSLDWKLRPPAA